MQTSYAIDIPPVSYPGQIVDLANNDIISGLAEVAIPYGKFVAKGSATTEPYRHIGKLPTAATDITTVANVLGVSVADQGRAQDSGVTLPTYPIGAAVPMMRKGRLWVIVEEAVTKGQAVYVRFSAGATLTELGAFGQDDGDEGGGALRALLANAIYLTAAGAGEYAQLELNLV